MEQVDILPELSERLFEKFCIFRKWWDAYEKYVTVAIGIASGIAYFAGQASTDYNDSMNVRVLKYMIYAITYSLHIFELKNWTHEAILFDPKHSFEKIKRIPLILFCLITLGVSMWVKSTYATRHQLLSFIFFATFLTICTCSISLRLLSQIEQWLKKNSVIFHIDPIEMDDVPSIQVPLPSDVETPPSENPIVDGAPLPDSTRADAAAPQRANPPTPLNFHTVVTQQCQEDSKMHEALSKKIYISMAYLIVMTAVFYAYLSVLNQKEYPGATCILCIALCVLLQTMSMMQIAVFNSRWLDLQLRYNRTTKLPVQICGFVLTYSLVLTVVLNGLVNGGLLLKKSLVNYSEL